MDANALSVIYPTASAVGCSRCPALCVGRTQIVDGAGPDHPLLLVVGEAPGADEDVAGVPFVGRSGKLLRDTLAELGAFTSNTRFTNAVRCHPEGNRDPSTDEIVACGQWLQWEIESAAPRAILAVGRVAEAAVRRIADGLFFDFFTAWHPAYVLRNPKKRVEWLKQLAPAVTYALTGQVPQPTTPTPDPWEEGIPVMPSPWLSVDTETDDLEEGIGVKLVSYQLSDGQKASFRTQRGPGSWPADMHVFAHNIKYDAPLLNLDLRNLGLWDDTALIAYVLRHERVGLKTLGPALTGLDMTPIKEILTRTEIIDQGIYKSGPNKGLPKPPKFKKVKQSFSEALTHEPERARQYALLDPVVTSRLAQILYPKLQAEPTLLRYYREIEKPIVPILQEMEARGVLVDPDKLTMLHAEIASRVGKHESMAKLALGVDDDFNLASNDQLATALQAIGVPLTNRTATGKLSVDEQSLLASVGATTEGHIEEMLVGDADIGDHNRLHLALVRDILKVRELKKLDTVYVERLHRDRDANSRIHGRINQMVTNTNRLSSSDPNLQNIPARDPLGKTIREAFVARPGYVIVKADYSQLEVRIYAALSGESVLVSAYPLGREERDCHQGVADALGIPRKRAKNVLFATLYGASAPKLAATAGVPQSESGAFLARMRQEMPTLLTWQQRQADEITRKGYIETLLGWRGYFPTYWSPVQRDQNEALREMANFPIQGTAAGIVKLLMIAADELAPSYGAELVLQVHDEVVYEVPEAHAASFSSTLEALGAQIGQQVGLSVPLKLNVEIGPSWGEVQDWRQWATTASPTHLQGIW